MIRDTAVGVNAHVPHLTYRNPLRDDGRSADVDAAADAAARLVTCRAVHKPARGLWGYVVAVTSPVTAVTITLGVSQAERAVPGIVERVTAGRGRADFTLAELARIAQQHRANRISTARVTARVNARMEAARLDRDPEPGRPTPFHRVRLDTRPRGRRCRSA